jgi:glycosyltransferase involved in cell wall biosynthesis
MSVTVLVSVFNGQAYLTTAIESVVRQTLGDLEFIIDEGSNDDSYSIIQSYARRDPRVVKIQQNYRGLPAALNVALSFTKNECVARLDADDKKITRLEWQLFFLSQHPPSSRSRITNVSVF